MSDESLQLCPVCGTPVEAGAAFCDACGADLSAEVAKVEPHAESAEGAEEKPHAESAEVAEEKTQAAETPRAEVAGGGLDSLMKMLEGLLASRRPPFAPAPVPAPVADLPAERPETPPPPSRPVPAPVADLPANRPETPPPQAGPVPVPDDLVPFSVEWDSNREFIEGVRCHFAFRVRCRRRISLLQLGIEVNGEPAESVSFRDLEDGDWREELLGFVPKQVGGLTVRLSALVCSAGGSRERFDAKSPFEHRVNPFRRLLPVGSQNVSIDNRDNHGIIRLDNLRLPAQAVEDLKAEIDRTLEKKGCWRDVPFDPGRVLRDCIRFRSGDRDLLVVAGSDLVTFGMHSPRPTVALSAESADGIVDERRRTLVSRIHFSIRRDPMQQRFVLRDGGPSKENPAKWVPSTNRTELDGADVSVGRPLAAGRTFEIDLAPGTVDGSPALRLSAETRGWDDPAAAGCPFVGNLSSILFRYPDNPCKAVLVVWGGADLGAALGTGAGPVVRTIRGRLHLVRPGERPRRLRSFEGRTLPGTPFLVL